VAERKPLIKVIVAGALGRVGSQMITGLAADDELDLAGGADPIASEEYRELPGGGGLIPITKSVGPLITRVRPDVMVDFTHPTSVMENVHVAISQGVRPVVGTTGLTPQHVSEIADALEKAGIGGVIAPNFATGANLLMYFARVASRFFPSAEIIELHHDAKVDAPSGTALATARLMREARDEPMQDASTDTFTLDGVRGGVEGGIRIHSVRLPGLVAHQEVILGGPGQLLSMRHDSMNRESFVPGVALAIKEVMKQSGLIYGLDKIMGLE